jgi:SagB-type dehydrogenase family enzyme
MLKRIIAFYLVFWIPVSFNVGAKDMERIKLPKPKLKSNFSVEEAISKRRSVRRYSSRRLTNREMGQLLWACQGITDRRGLRAAPSAGALYPLEIYILIENGIYRYLPKGHELQRISNKNLKKKLTSAAWGQRFVEEAPLNIIICAVYERVTSRYGERGIKYTDIEAGHAAENIHLQAVSLGMDSCSVGAFDDAALSKVLSLSGKEKPIYIIPVGYKRQ